MFDREAAKQRLVDVITTMKDSKDVKEELAKIRAKAEALKEQQGDKIIWYELLASMNSWGGANTYIILEDSTVTFEALSALASDEAVEAALGEAIARAKMRYPNDKREYLLRNFQKIREMGGEAAATKAYKSLEGWKAKRKFWDDFAGIGPKYARNIPMDMYDDDFKDVIAVDDRIKDIADALGFSEAERNDYCQMEEFFLDVAEDCGIDGWELDRIMYQFEPRILKELNNMPTE